MHFKHLAILSFITSLAGTAIAAPIAPDLSLVAHKFRRQGTAAAAPGTGTQAAAASTGGTPCTNFDQSAAAFSGNDPDEDLPQCSTVADPLPCTNIQAVATDFNVALCSTVNSAPATATTAATQAADSTGSTPCTNTDQSAAAFGGNDPDEDLPLCSTVASPFECTNIQAVATDFNLPLCSTVGSTAATAAAATTSAALAASTQAAATTGTTPCTNTDQSAAAFSGNDPDEDLPLCSTVASPFECTNIQAVATAFNLPLCSTA
ncbi:hypothetical protein DFH07DRAFT_842208 [Mycena maculata]|uniref:Uncharacterized protein n=1 Tax=Mycena maculata TaxID=230809 RepID=A0AAD7I8I7_9AGAR|nr:hypothetical protein DFH07DRAFT_842208 [Mycena maculata]